jgi:Paraquat-inducible protein A
LALLLGRFEHNTNLFERPRVGAAQRSVVITIPPGAGALASCAVMVLTMFPAETFDPRLMWDVAIKRERGSVGLDPRFAGL